jgi:hypothetical protein
VSKLLVEAISHRQELADDAVLGEIKYFGFFGLRAAAVVYELGLDSLEVFGELFGAGVEIGGTGANVRFGVGFDVDLVFGLVLVIFLAHGFLLIQCFFE